MDRVGGASRRYGCRKGAHAIGHASDFVHHYKRTPTYTSLDRASGDAVSGTSTPSTDEVADAAKAKVYLADLTALMEIAARGLVSLRYEYKAMVAASDAASAAKLDAVKNVQSLGPISGDNVWAKAITALGGAAS